MRKCKPVIALTLGDPAGVGPEVAAMALAKRSVRDLASFVIVGHDAVLREACQRCGVRLAWEVLDRKRLTVPAGIGLVEPSSLAGKAPRPGRWTARTGRLSLACVETAITLCIGGVVNAMVTGPICKAAWGKAGADWPGHTELLAARTGTDDFVMMLAGGGLRVALVTIHEPLAAVPELVTREKVESTVRVVHEGLKRDFGLKLPRIAVLGLNPHAGEEGRLGNEEAAVLQPAVNSLRRANIDAIGPIPADTAFHAAMNGGYDAVVAMYHDQGLGPLKTVAFDTGVNITLGLPIVRTSVDHGTAFDIAGTGTANPASCIAAIRTAVLMAANRKRA